MTSVTQLTQTSFKTTIYIIRNRIQPTSHRIYVNVLYLSAFLMF